MRLSKLSYVYRSWELLNLELDSVNLIVAKNATGKSRTLLAIDYLTNILVQKRNLEHSCSWNIQFSSSDSITINYNFEVTIESGIAVVSNEQLWVSGEAFITRDRESCQLKNMLTGLYDDVHPPSNKLTLHANRDVKKYSYIEDVSEWAENSYGFKFGSIIPFSDSNSALSTFLTTVEDIPDLFKALDIQSRSEVLTQFNNVGYDIAEINFQEIGDSGIILVREQGLEVTLSHSQLAQGMFRTLCIIIYLEYLMSQKKPSLVIIDDLCEGLDYDRARKLGKMVFDKCINSNIQLVATSNDSFLMDVVDIKYWNVLQRKGKVVTALNRKNHPKLFSDFKFTGLSNFDFFASDFLNQELEL